MHLEIVGQLLGGMDDRNNCLLQSKILDLGLLEGFANVIH